MNAKRLDEIRQCAADPARKSWWTVQAIQELLDVIDGLRATPLPEELAVIKERAEKAEAAVAREYCGPGQKEMSAVLLQDVPRLLLSLVIQKRELADLRHFLPDLIEDYAVKSGNELLSITFAEAHIAGHKAGERKLAREVVALWEADADDMMAWEKLIDRMRGIAERRP